MDCMTLPPKSVFGFSVNCCINSYLVIPCLFWLVNITDQSFITPENYLLDKKNATRDEGLKMSLDCLVQYG